MVVFHLSIPIGYVELAPFFCASIETVKEMVNNTTSSRIMKTAYPLDKLEDTAPTGYNRDAKYMIVQKYEQWRRLPDRAYQ